MELLPPPVLRNVLAFAVPGYAEKLVLGRRNDVAFVLKELKTVARAWLEPMRDVVRRYTLKTLMIHLGREQGLQLVYERAASRGAVVTELIVSGTDRTPGEREAVDATNVDWSRLLGALTGLKTLDLTALYPSSRHVLEVLEAAVTHSQNLESLLLPYSYFGVDEDKIQAVMNKTYDAMRRWRADGNIGGLRHLSAPTRNNKDKFQASKEFIENVIKHCPLVERLDGYKMSMQRWSRLTCKDAWLLTIEDWQRFNAACTNLTEFHWIVVPFGDPFFRVFGQHVKPRMKKLVLGVNMFWNWNWYFHDTSEAAGALPAGNWKEDYCERPGYGSLAKDPAAALKGCPLLDELEVILYHPVDPDLYVNPDEGDVLDFREEEMINQDAFDDRFCAALAKYCPFLTRFVIQEIAELYNARNMRPILTFTDQGLMALTQLKYLRTLQLRSINCTGKGLLEFLNHLSLDFKGNRTFEIYVGGCLPESKIAFYDVVRELLTELARAPNAVCTGHRFALSIENWSYNSSFEVDRDWSERYLEELEQLMARVKDAHPSLRQHVVTMDRRGNTFMRIAAFGLYSIHTDSTVYSGWEDWETVRDQNTAITFADRERMDNEMEDDSAYYDYDEQLQGDFYDDEYNESDIDDEYLEEDDDYEM